MNMMKHLEQRKCNPLIYPGIGINNEVVCFPLYNFGYKRTGFVAYRPDGPKRVQNNEKGKYWTYISSGEVGVFGMESIDYTPYILLVSGVFKATALHQLGQSALHISSVSPRVLQRQLGLLKRPYVAIGDNDAEGVGFARRYGGRTSPRDVDEMSYDEIKEFVSELVNDSFGTVASFTNNSYSTNGVL